MCGGVRQALVAQQKAQSPITISNRQLGYKPEHVELGNGRYKVVSRNSDGQIFHEDVYQMSGQMMSVAEKIQDIEVNAIYQDGSVAEQQIRILTAGRGRQDGIEREEHVKYDTQGKPIEKITYQVHEHGKLSRKERTVTTWPTGSGPEGVTKTQEYDVSTGNWQEYDKATGQWRNAQADDENNDPSVAPFTGSLIGKWRLWSNGQEVQGSYRIDENVSGSVLVMEGSNIWIAGSRKGNVMTGVDMKFSRQHPGDRSGSSGVKLQISEDGREVEIWRVKTPITGPIEYYKSELKLVRSN